MSHPDHLQDPAQADIIIRETRHGSKQYTLGTVTQPAQLCCPNYADAVTRARHFARIHRVSIWWTVDGVSFTSVAMDDSAPSPERARPKLVK